METNKIGHLLRKVTPIIDRTGWHLVRAQNTVRDGDTVIIFTERGSLMHDARTIGVCHVRVHDNPKCLVLELRHQEIS